MLCPWWGEALCADTTMNHHHHAVQAWEMDGKAVERQLLQLNKEIKETQPELKAAYSAWEADPESAVKRTRYEDLKKKEEGLDARRAQLEAKLTGEGAGTCCHHLAS